MICAKKDNQQTVNNSTQKGHNFEIFTQIDLLLPTYMCKLTMSGAHLGMSMTSFLDYFQQVTSHSFHGKAGNTSHLTLFQALKQ
jgi:hypothetical protein